MDILPEDQQDLMLQLLRHMALLTYNAVPSPELRAKGYEVFPACAPGSLIQADEHLCWVTAGHQLEFINELRTKGYSIQSPRLFDHWIAGGIQGDDNGVPIELDTGDEFIITDDETGVDLGGILLRYDRYYLNLFEKTGIVPMNERLWEDARDVPAGLKEFLIIGTPDETTRRDVRQRGTTTKLSGAVQPVLAPIELVSDPPPNMQTQYARLIGRLRDDLVPDDEADGRPLKDFRGMSGGPVFAIWRDTAGRIRYRVVGVQSKWIRSKRLVAACWISDIAILVRDFYKQLPTSS